MLGLSETALPRYREHRSRIHVDNNLFMNHQIKQTFVDRYGLELAQIFLLIAITAFAYSNTLHGEFVFDDNDVILQNHIKWTDLNFESLANVWQNSLHKNRPVANISFALNYFFHQYNVAGYHLVNIVIHITAGVFLFLLVKTTISLPSLQSRRYSQRWVPFLTALIWLVHPVQTQSVTYLVQRMNSMAAMFYVMAVFFYVKGRLAEERWAKVGFLAGCVLIGLLAFGTKEIAWSLPVFIGLYDWYFLRDLSCDGLKKYSLPTIAALFVFILAAAFFHYGVNPFSGLLAAYASRDFTLAERLLTESRVVLFYISLLVYPHLNRFNLDHDFVLSRSLLAPPSTMLSLVVLGALLTVVIVAARRQRLLSFAILWLLGNLVIESSIIPLEIVFEHRLYLPAMMATLILVLGLFEYVRNPPVLLALSVVLVLTLVFGTYHRNQVWADPLSLWGDVVNKSPEKARGYSNLGVYVEQKGDIAAAEFNYRKSIKLDPTNPNTHNNLANIMADRGQFARAIMHYSKALSIRPNNPYVCMGLGKALMRAGRLHEAKEQFEKAMELRPGFVDARLSLSLVNKRIEARRRGRGNPVASY